MHVFSRIICLLTFCLFFSCNKNITKFSQGTVHFYQFQNYRIIPATFETVTTNMLLVEAHNKGAKFDTIYEEIKVKDAYWSYGLTEIDSFTFMIKPNAFIDSKEEVSCFMFSGNDKVETPTRYRRIKYYKVKENGNGEFVEAFYKSYTSQKLVSLPTLEKVSHTNRNKISYNFRLPPGVGFEDYFYSQIGDSDFKLTLGENYDLSYHKVKE